MTTIVDVDEVTRNQFVASLTGYVRYVADRIGLPHWEICLEADPCPPGRAATSLCIEGRSLIHISFAEDFDEYRPQEQRYAVCHELSHAILDPLRQTIKPIKHELPKPSYRMLRETHDRALELAVDAFARAMSKDLPTFPEWKCRQEENPGGV